MPWKWPSGIREAPGRGTVSSREHGLLKNGVQQDNSSLLWVRLREWGLKTASGPGNILRLSAKKSNLKHQHCDDKAEGSLEGSPGLRQWGGAGYDPVRLVVLCCYFKTKRSMHTHTHTHITVINLRACGKQHLRLRLPTFINWDPFPNSCPPSDLWFKYHVCKYNCSYDEGILPYLR
jgi:hypothetical protein